MSDEYAEFRDEKPPQNALDQVKEGVKLLIKYDQYVAECEALLVQAKARRNKHKYEDLPVLMQQLGGLAEFDMEMDDGQVYHVVREEKISARLSEGNSAYVFQWMKEHGYEHHVSNDLVVPFTKGQQQELRALEEHIKQFNDGKVQYSCLDNIHPSTYTAFCKRLKKDGVAIEDKLFGIHVVNQVSAEPK